MGLSAAILLLMVRARQFLQSFHSQLDASRQAAAQATKAISDFESSDDAAYKSSENGKVSVSLQSFSVYSLQHAAGCDCTEAT